MQINKQIESEMMKIINEKKNENGSTVGAILPNVHKFLSVRIRIKRKQQTQ